MTLPTDEEILRFSVSDPDLTQARNFMRDKKREARMNFAYAASEVAAYEAEPVDPAVDAMQKDQLIAAKQRKENWRAQYSYWNERVGSLPADEKEKASNVRPLARDAST